MIIHMETQRGTESQTHMLWNIMHLLPDLQYRDGDAYFQLVKGWFYNVQCLDRIRRKHAHAQAVSLRSC